MTRETTQKYRQKGVVLAVSLIMLVLITLLSVSAMRTTVMEERMASNARNNNIAFQMAENAQREAEGLLAASPNAKDISLGSSQNIGSFSSTSCEVVFDSIDFFDQLQWDTKACNYTGASVGGSKLPQYFIEFITAKSLVVIGSVVGTSAECLYRITSRGYGPDSNSQKTLQTTYRFSNCS